jgi:hypothetical protein
MARTTKLEPAPLAYPSGGGLAAMAEQRNKVKKLEHQKIDLEAQIKHAKLNEKPKPTKPTSSGKAK